MYRQDPIVINEFYHIFNRGYDKMKIFNTENDYHRFLLTILRYQEEYPNICLYSYCLLPNHFHFIIIDRKSEGESDIPDFMRKLQNSYGKYYNIKNGRKGQFFEGRYKANHLGTEHYFLNAIIYVNGNAVKHGIVDNIDEWSFSSYNYFKYGEILKSTPVLKSDFGGVFDFEEIYNKYKSLDLTPVLEY